MLREPAGSYRLTMLVVNGSHMSIPRLKPYLAWMAAVLMLGQVITAQAEALPDFTSLVEQASPAVVNISTRQKCRTARLPRVRCLIWKACHRCCANFSSAARRPAPARQEGARAIVSVRRSH